MKKILLLGDSIRQCYDQYVREELKDKADVRFHHDNGRFCQYTLRYVHEWINKLYEPEQRDIDIIHFNCGLWDVLRLTGDDDNLIPISSYAEQLTRIVHMLKHLCPDAIILFALTTPVIEPGFAPGPDIGIRLNADIKKYNATAVDVLKPWEIGINDLWTTVSKAPKTVYSDQVHFQTELGIQTLGKAVSSFLIPYLE
ncbi:hypothetical protein [Sporomusa sp. GT1]|uniref:hypothetical protein n=1 Tax=Sporomusa sp. GT1 TaxID=1534747 RepID=UPI001665042A|nr:hypothetical protein [Sporomusa sp. GT1]